MEVELVTSLQIGRQVDLVTDRSFCLFKSENDILCEKGLN